MAQEHWRLAVGLSVAALEILVTEEIGRDAIAAWKENVADKHLTVEGYSDSADRAEYSLCIRFEDIVYMSLVRMYG